MFTLSSKEIPIKTMLKIHVLSTIIVKLKIIFLIIYEKWFEWCYVNMMEYPTAIKIIILFRKMHSKSIKLNSNTYNFTFKTFFNNV